MKYKLNLDKLLVIAGVIAILVVGVFFIWWNSNSGVIEISNDTSAQGEGLSSGSPITGVICERMHRRPVAVMLAADPVARPVSGIGQADIMFEMPVTPDGVTRMMAVYQCQYPKEIGSIRSARMDFIPFVKGLDALYAHWGGEKEALERLDAGVVDNVDAMKYEGTTFFRKSYRRRPHNGFTSLDLLLERAENLNYSLDNTFDGYLHMERDFSRTISNIATDIQIPYASPFNVSWQYDEQDGVYRRLRNGTKEIDANTDKQVSARVVIIMETTSRPLDRDYNRVIVTGEGTAKIYQGGIVVSGKWKKNEESNGKLFFLDSNGDEIIFLPGPIWIEIITK